MTTTKGLGIVLTGLHNSEQDLEQYIKVKDKYLKVVEA
jgi:hypothetical protein